MRKKIVAGNWKMHLTLPEALELAGGLKADISIHENVEVIVAPSFPFLHPVCEILKGSSIGVAAQNMHWAESGAFTGEVSASMLLSVGVDKVILGHSERRRYFGENEEVLQKKIKVALNNDMQVIYCVGETLSDREAGIHFDIVQRQITDVLSGLSQAEWKHMVIAYEPVWAIGTGRTATPGQAQEMHKFIRQTVAETTGEEVAQGLRILYGGSVKPANAAEIFARPDVDGGLIGGASLKAEDFLSIIQAAK